MATRLYMTSRAVGTMLTGPPLGEWSGGDSTRDNRGENHWTMLLAETNALGGVITTLTGGASITKANDQAIPIGNLNGGVRWVTRPLDTGQTISGTITVTHKTENPGAAALAEVYGQLYAYVSNGDTLTQRTVLVANVVHATVWTATATYRTMTYNIAGSVAGLAGDRIVLEPGASCSPPTAPDGDNIFTVKYGTTNSLQVAQADATDGQTADRAAWVEFSANLTFQAAPSAPANDACVDATVIAPTLPYTSSAVDTTTSTDTGRRVWWTWTAPEDMTVVASSFGGNYQTTVSVLTGACGALVSLVNGSAISWIGTSQSACVFEATSGTQYWFRVTSDHATAGTQAALTADDSGGSLVFNLRRYRAPQDGDLFVSCQHIAAFTPDGVLVNDTDIFYGNTPTNSCIDYTLRPMDDLNGGTNASRRLNIALFGTDPTVEVLDLDTLNVNESQIDFIFDPLNDTGHSENALSIVIDDSGRLLIGYAGDNYSVLGQASTLQQCRVNRIDATHADNQAGAPWPMAEAFEVAIENEGSDYIDLSTDGVTLFYTSAGRLVKRYDLGASSQGANFATLPLQTQNDDCPRPGARGIRLLSPYDGSGGALVAYGNCVHRIDSFGSVIGTFTPTHTHLAKDLDKVELDPSAVTAYVSDQLSTHIFRFNIESMTQVSMWPTLLPPGQLSGFTVLGYRGSSPSSFTIETETRMIRRQRTTPIVSANGVRLLHKMCQVDLRVGVGLTTGQGSNPLVIFQTSRDGGRTWSDERFSSAGALGNYLRRAMFWQNGQGRSVAYRITVSDPVAWQVVALYVELQECLS